MCSRYYRFKDLKDLYVRFKIAEILSILGPQYNIAPTDKALIIPATEGKRVAKDMVFGIINPFMGILGNPRDGPKLFSYFPPSVSQTTVKLRTVPVFRVKKRNRGEQKDIP